jgi:hypothetical protein
MPKSRVGSASNNSVTTSGTSSGVGKKGSLRNVISRRVQKVTCSGDKRCGNNVCGGSFKANAACGRFRW